MFHLNPAKLSDIYYFFSNIPRKVISQIKTTRIDFTVNNFWLDQWTRILINCMSCVLFKITLKSDIPPHFKCNMHRFCNQYAKPKYFFYFIFFFTFRYCFFIKAIGLNVDLSAGFISNEFLLWQCQIIIIIENFKIDEKKWPTIASLVCVFEQTWIELFLFRTWLHQVVGLRSGKTV